MPKILLVSLASEIPVLKFSFPGFIFIGFSLPILFPLSGPEIFYLFPSIVSLYCIGFFKGIVSSLRNSITFLSTILRSFYVLQLYCNP